VLTFGRESEQDHVENTRGTEVGFIDVFLGGKEGKILWCNFCGVDFVGKSKTFCGEWP